MNLNKYLDSVEDSLELGILEDLRDTLKRWVDDIYETGVPNDNKIQHTNVNGKLSLKVHNHFMTRPEEEGKSYLWMTLEQLEGDE